MTNQYEMKQTKHERSRSANDNRLSEIVTGNFVYGTK